MKSVKSPRKVAKVSDRNKNLEKVRRGGSSIELNVRFRCLIGIVIGEDRKYITDIIDILMRLKSADLGCFDEEQVMNEGISDIIMTVEEVSEYLKLAQSTIYKLLNEGKLPGRKVGGSWRFSRQVLDEWIKMGDSFEKYFVSEANDYQAKEE